MKEELRSRHEIQVAQEAKRQKVIETAQRLGVSVPDEVMVSDKVSVRAQLDNLNKIYLEKVRFGEEISNILSEGQICEECLTKEHKHALELYRQQRLRLDVTEVVLRSWQKDAFALFQQKANDRTVMWIYDGRGNSGKSWFLNYIEAYFGYNRVFRCDLRIKHKDMCNILRKRCTTTVDIFLFNDSRSIMGEEPNMYRILEDIKDGAATTSKYDNQVLKFKTPNFVMVFSNSWPNRRHLSKDRWQIFEPSGNGLKLVEKDRALTKDVSVRMDVDRKKNKSFYREEREEIHE